MKPKAERRTVKLTKTVVEKLEPGEVTWDSDLPGFGVRRRVGRPSYVIKYGTGRRGRSRWYTIGRHGGPWVDKEGAPCMLTADRARTEATRLLGEIAKGANPAEARARARALPTLAEFSTRYLEEYASIHKKPSTYKENVASLKPIVKALGRTRIDQITSDDVTRYHLSRKATPTSANREIALISHMWTQAKRWGLVTTGNNPCEGLKKFPETKRKRYLSEDELARLAIALTKAEKRTPWGVAAIRLLLFTGARRSEILGLKWKEVDLERGVLELADSKTGERVVQLNPPAVALLAALPRITGNPYVFPGRKEGEHITDVKTLWDGVRTNAKLEDARVHDLRHSFASILVSSGASLPLIGGLLGHTSAATTQRYAHLSDSPLKAASERAGELLGAAMKKKAAK